MQSAISITPNTRRRLQAVADARRETLNNTVQEALDYWYETVGIGRLETATGMRLPLPKPVRGDARTLYEFVRAAAAD